MDSAMGEDGVMGYIPATSLNAYATYAAAVFPSMVILLLISDLLIEKYSEIPN
jgi:hypothetical protein